MNDEKIKAAAECISMPDDMKRRILGNISAVKAEPRTRLRRPVAVLAVLGICLTLSATALAATGTLQGFFRDITDWRGAVIGTAYEQATDEIALSAVVSGDELIVSAEFLNLQAAPYRCSEQLGIAAYQIIDAAGNTVQEGAADSVPVVEGKAEIPVGLSGLASGSYRLRITACLSEKKADQPLEISGNWELSFDKP